MSKIQELIREKCPNGVEYKYLGNFMVRRKEKCNEANSKFVVYSVTNTMGLVKSDEFHDTSIYSSNVSNYLKVYPNDFVYNPARLNVKSLARMKNNEIGIVSPMYIVFYIDNNVMLNEYFEYLIFSYKVHDKILSSVEQGARFRFDYNNWNKIEVPVPPIKVQEEIVRILDKFGELEAELEAELETRKRQYEFWREKLLKKTSDRKMVKLKEIVYFENGKGHEREISEEGKYILLTSKAVSTNLMKYRRTDNQLLPLYKNDIALVMSDLPKGKALAKCFFVNQDGKYTLNQRVCRISVKNKQVLPKYLYYFLDRNDQLLKFDNGVDQTNLRKNDILELNVFLPSLQDQIRIIKILDKFNQLVNNISEGLPAEIELRRKQYEYYRNKLLSFPEISNEKY